MSVVFYHVNAFTTQSFTGNPAAVVILHSDEQFNDDSLLQKVATEFNLPATTFLLPLTQTVNDVLKQKIKWFDPSNRIPICGHRTLASSHVLLEGHSAQVHTIEYDAGPAGSLTARRDKGNSIQLDFPACRLVGMQDAGQAIKEGVDLEQVLKSLFPDDVKIEFVRRGDRGGYVDLLVVEVMEDYPLKGKKLNNHVLVGNNYTTLPP
jgi:PhzF family phenazine biosynthesis protein